MTQSKDRNDSNISMGDISYRTSSRRRSNSYHNEPNGPLGIIYRFGPILFLPLLFVYLEIVFHIYMDLDLKYFWIYLFFALSAGTICSIFTILFHKTANRILTYLITWIVCLAFCIEIVCKTVLQTYYQLLSSADTAANNQLTDYIGPILNGISKNIVGFILILLPLVFLYTIGRKRFTYGRKKLPVILVTLVSAIIFHLIALGTLHLPWKGDFLPKDLYFTDTNVDDQVEQLGMITMLRLDVKHYFFGVKSNLSGEEDFDDLANLTATATPDATASQGPTTTKEPDDADETTHQVDTSPNEMDIDFDSLIDTSKDENVVWLSKYFKSLTPTNKNEYTGMMKDYNVIFITAEGFSKYLISKELTPTLYKLSNEGFVFNNYYTPLHFTSTSGGEFQNLTGLYPKNGMPISLKTTGEQGTNLFFSLANQLNRLGYDSIGYHNNTEMYGRRKSHPNLGYDWNQGGEGFDMELSSSGNKVWPQSDKYMIETTVDEYLDSDKPFNIYYMTVSGHMPYNFTGDQMAVKNKERVANLPYTDETKAYLAANLELEDALTTLLDKLESAGKLDKTLLVFTADHIPYFNVNILEELSGKNFGNNGDLENLNESNIDFDVYRNTLIMWSASMEEPVQVDKICTQTDILPTVSNLLGLEYDSRLLAGTDILSTSSPLVIFSSSCWLTDKGLYNRYSGKFTLADGVKMNQEEIDDYVNKMKKIVRYKLQSSNLIIEKDYYNLLFPTSKK